MACGCGGARQLGSTGSQLFEDQHGLGRADLGHLLEPRKHDVTQGRGGRTKQVFRSGGYNIYPREIELALESHPSVKLAAVVPRPDPGYQEVGVAYVELQPDTQASPAELLGWARGRLANYKVPKSLVLLGQLPTLPNEKIDKRRLQRLAAGGHDPDLQQ